MRAVVFFNPYAWNLLIEMQNTFRHNFDNLDRSMAPMWPMVSVMMNQFGMKLHPPWICAYA